MAIVASKKVREYESPDEGLHSAVCCDVIDLGMVTHAKYGAQHKVEIRWLLEEVDSAGKNFLVSSRYTLSLHEKSRLRPMLEAWRGRKFTTEELEYFDLEKLLGQNCQLQIVHNIKDEGGVWANVQAVVGAAKNATKLRVNGDYIRVCEREKRAQLEANPNGYQADDSDVPF